MRVRARIAVVVMLTALSAVPTLVRAQDASPDRLFKVLPNAAMVPAGATAPPITTKLAFHFATVASFDKYVIPFVITVAAIGLGDPPDPYWRRFPTAFADNTIGNYLSTAVMPSLLKQDPRYYQLGTGSVWHRVIYAASRTAVTRSRTGSTQFNFSEVGGIALAGTIANAYYPPEDRTAGSTMTRIGSRLMWDTLTYECQEFWPDIRRHLEKHRRPNHG